MQKTHGHSLFGTVRRLCAVALLTALAVVIAYLCKSLTFMQLRITFENLPIILAGYLFGPIAGMCCGLAADFLSAAMFYGLGGLSPLVTVGAGVVGFAAGAMPRWILRRPGTLQLCVSVASAHVLGNMLVKSIGLAIYYGYTLPQLLLRVPQYIILGGLELLLLCILLRSKGVQKVIREI